MRLQSDPTLAEVPGFSTEQLESLTRSVAQKQQKLEADIDEYIRRKQDELRNYEREMREAMEPHNANLSSEPPAPPAELSPESKKAEEKAKRTKHTRVHKREKELCGLVTPIFLPLLDAGEASPTQNKERKERKKQHKEEKAESASIPPPTSEQSAPSRDNEKGKEVRRSKSSEFKMEQGELVNKTSTKENQKPDLAKKSKRPAIKKKSSLRNNGGEKIRRKRVSLVIDDQIVLPADEYANPPLTSPSETTASSASNSTTSLDETSDPRFTARVESPIQEHQDPVHHSLPLPMHLPSSSPTKHTGHTLPDSPPSNSPGSLSRSPHSPLQYEPPQTTTRTFLDPSPPSAKLDIPQFASASPIYASEPDLAETTEEDFDTYVGGIDGSGVDDLDQAGSYGYPSSLGASYLESYMQNRPLSVRMAAAEKAGLGEEEKERLIKGKKKEDEDLDLDVDVGRVDDVDEDMEVIGSMENI